MALSCRFVFGMVRDDRRALRRSRRPVDVGVLTSCRDSCDQGPVLDSDLMTDHQCFFGQAKRPDRNERIGVGLEPPIIGGAASASAND